MLCQSMTLIRLERQSRQRLSAGTAAASGRPVVYREGRGHNEPIAGEDDVFGAGAPRTYLDAGGQGIGHVCAVALVADTVRWRDVLSVAQAGATDRGGP